MRVVTFTEELVPGEARDVTFEVQNLDPGDTISEPKYAITDKSGVVLQEEADAVLNGANITGRVVIEESFPRELRVNFTYLLNSETVISRVVVLTTK